MEYLRDVETSSVEPNKLLSYFIRSFLVLSFVFLSVRLYLKRKNIRDAMDKLPGSKERLYNFLGRMILLVNHYIFKYPAPFHAYHSILMAGYVKAYGKHGVAALWQINYPAVLVYKAEAVETILSHNTEIQKAWFYKFLHPWLGDGLLTTKGQKWKERRKLLTPAFHFNILKDFLPVFNKQSSIFVDVLQKHAKSEHVEIVSLITKCSFDIICESILGAEMHSQTCDDCDYLQSVTTITDKLADRVLKPWLWPDILFALSPTGRKFRYHNKKVKDLANKLISSMKQQKLAMKARVQENEDKAEEEEYLHSRKKRALLDLLLDEHINNNSISLDEIREEVDTFKFEGHDTTAMGMSWSIYLIGLHPEVQDKIHAELDSIFGNDDRDVTMDDLRDMKYLECVIKETLRIYPSVPGYGRKLLEDVPFKDQVWPKGITCFIWAYSLHRDPKYFPNPEQFDPERFTPENSAGRHPFAYVPFSAGPRNCIGQRFAMMELKCVLSAILRNYTVRSLTPRDQIHDLFEVVLRPHNGLKLEVRHRK